MTFKIRRYLLYLIRKLDCQIILIMSTTEPTKHTDQTNHLEVWNSKKLVCKEAMMNKCIQKE